MNDETWRVNLSFTGRRAGPPQARPDPLGGSRAVRGERGAPMTYAVKEIFYTLQGEGLHAGRPAVFCRFAGCNLWSGREADRASAICRFCDTEFVGTDGTLGGKYAKAQALAQRIASLWPTTARDHRYVVLTGGEPLLQVDAPLLEALHREGFEVAVETNGTIAAPPGIDWICMSPKAGAVLAQTTGQELKLVYPQNGLPPAAVEHLKFEHFLLQPMDGPARAANTQAALAYCQAHPQWRLSLQLHKVLAIR
jgi:7-carboxy-7-deazaguanine synthase